MHIHEKITSEVRSHSIVRGHHPPIVCVVIPTYNRPDRLKECLEALSLQSIPRSQFEVIVVDDGSIVPVYPVVEAFNERLNLKLVRQTNSGPATARNRGVQESQAELIAFTDDDCRPRPDWLRRLMDAEELYPGSLIGGSTVNGLPDGLCSSTNQFITDLVYHHFNRDPFNSTFLASNNMLCRRPAFLEIGGFDVGFPLAGGEDRDFCDRWRSSGQRIVWHNEAVIDHFHSQSLTGFLELHFRYGRGAYAYQSERRIRGTGNIRDDLGFQTSLMGFLKTHLFTRFGLLNGMRMLTLLALWQCANTGGFLFASLQDRMKGKKKSV